MSNGPTPAPQVQSVADPAPLGLAGFALTTFVFSSVNAMDIGDVTTLANLDIVEQIRIMVQGEAKVATKAGPEDKRVAGSRNCKNAPRTESHNRTEPPASVKNIMK